MSSSIHSLKFLLDENVRVELLSFLSSKGYNAKRVPPSSSDTQVASISKKERRILVTNDEDFIEYAKDEIFSVVWLRIPQNDATALRDSFEKLLNECHNFSGKLVVLNINEWNPFPLVEKVSV